MAGVSFIGLQGKVATLDRQRHYSEVEKRRAFSQAGCYPRKPNKCHVRLWAADYTARGQY
ncbi:MAG TPA: hypothetical protein VK395_30220 [Gemmataceae bacterium]|nr:hypothetical protein [Gemmataceae bacterium]